METTYLREYILLAERGSFTTTAHELHLTQSTLSKHIAALEREFGAEFFIRDRSGIKLTKAGKTLLDHAKEIDRMMCSTYEAVRNTEQGTTKRKINMFDPIHDTALRCKCGLIAEKYGLSKAEKGALILYLEERGFEVIQKELTLTRDELADMLGSVYTKLEVHDKQELFNLIHSILEWK